MIRVLIFTPTLASGGADRVTVTLLESLDRTRFEPTLVLLRREGAFADAIPQGVRVIELDVPRLALATAALVRVLRREKPDVLFSMQGGANIIAAVAHVVSRSRARLVLSERSALRRPDRSALRTMLELPAKRATYRRADVVTAVSRGVATALLDELGLQRERVHLVYNPLVDHDLSTLAAHPVEHPWFAEDIPILLAIGRLVPIKDYPAMLAAFARLREGRLLRLFILGEGPRRPDLEAEAARLEIADDVHFHGFDPNVFKYLKRAAALVHTSRAEGLPGGIIQAMACGTPVVSTDADFGPREVIRHGIDGFLVPVGDVEAIASHLRRLLDDRELASTIGRAAAQSAQQFSRPLSMHRYQQALLGEPAPW
jgi:glycosyltransferase involved in cell wall biosynthesis